MCITMEVCPVIIDGVHSSPQAGIVETNVVCGCNYIRTLD